MQQDVQEVGHGLANRQGAHPVDLLVVVLWFCLVALQHIVRRRASTEYFWKNLLKILIRLNNNIDLTF